MAILLLVIYTDNRERETVKNVLWDVIARIGNSIHSDEGKEMEIIGDFFSQKRGNGERKCFISGF